MNNTSRLSTSSSMSSTRAALAPVRNQSGLRLRRFVFTLNNYTPDEYKWLTEVFPKWNPSWLIVAKEVGESGTLHLQGACILGKQVGFSTLKMWPGFRRAHVETMRGLPSASLAYCSKQDQNPFIFGDLPTPGKRTDLHVAVEAIQDGESLRDMALGDHGVAIVKFYKGLTMLRSLRSKPRDPSNPPKLYWVYGPTGSGKTRSCFEFGALIAGPSDVWLSNGQCQWFDGYDGQRVAILDDFRAKGVSFNFLLRLTDIYPFNVPFKGGFVNWAPDVIFFTAPHDIRTTFSTRFEHVPEDVRQLERRFTRSFLLPDDLAEFRELFRPSVSERVVDEPMVIIVPDSEESEDSELSLEATLRNSFVDEEMSSELSFDS